MRQQTSTSNSKLPPVRPELDARTRVLAIATPAAVERQAGSAPGESRPEVVPFESNLAMVEELAGDTHVAACVYFFPPIPMRDTIRTTLLIPKVGNDGVPFPDIAFATLEDVLLDLAGGFTRLGDVEGAWRAPDGTIMRDESRQYAVTLDAHLAEGAIREIDVFIREFFQQHAAFVEAVPMKATAF